MMTSGGLLAFGFVSPWLLVGGLALSAVPLLIHLLRRRQLVNRPWAAMQFLQAAMKTQSRRVRLESLALLAVRMLVIALAAVTLARPFVEELGGPQGGVAGRHRILVIDTSLSMTAGEPGATPLDQAKSLAAGIVESAPAADAFSVVVIARTPPLALIPQAAHDREAVVEMIRQLPARQERGDVIGALSAVHSCLRPIERSPRAEVILLSDFQGSNWVGDSEGADQKITTLLHGLGEHATFTCLPVSSAREANMALTDLSSARDPGTAGGIAEVEATVLNPGPSPAVDVTVKVFADQRLVGETTLDVAAGEQATARISLRGITPGDTSVRAEIADDALDADNVRWALLPDPGPLEVLLVSGRPRSSDRNGAADFVRLALSPAAGPGSETAIAATVINDDRLRDTELRRFRCIHLCNVTVLSDGDAARLRSYVENGGGLVISLGDQVQPSGYRALQGRADRALLPAELLGVVGGDRPPEDVVRFLPGEYSHPVIRPFAGNPDAGLVTTDIRRYWRLKLNNAADAEVVLKYSTGDPAIVERRFGSGRVFVITTALDDSWSNWALWPSFVPIVHEVTRAAAAGRIAERSRIVGDELTVHLAAEDFGVTGEYRRPDGHTTGVPNRTSVDGTTSMTMVAESSGIHELNLSPPRATVERFAVNVDSTESRLMPLDRDALAQLMPKGAFRYMRKWRPESSAVMITPDGGGSSLLVLSVLGLLLAEQLLTWHFRVGTACLMLMALGLAAATTTGRYEFALTGIGLLCAAALLAGLWVRRGGASP